MGSSSHWISLRVYSHVMKMALIFLPAVAPNCVETGLARLSQIDNRRVFPGSR